MTDDIVYRPFQKRFVESIENKIDQEDRHLFGNIHPGSGKTLAALAALNILYRRKLIDTAVVLTPRVNLCQQFELDYAGICHQFAEPRISSIAHRENVEPLRRSGEFGYVTSYQSLTSQPGIHFKFFREHQQRIALILDEAQQLGDCNLYGYGSSTGSADLVREVQQFGAFIITMSGTVMRSDGLPVLNGTYSEPDAQGIRYLEPDVEATYQEGVKEKYLREFEFELFDGKSIYEYINGEQEYHQLSNMRRQLYKVIRHPDYWHPPIDQTMERLRLCQSYDRRYCAIVGGDDQEHAREILDYAKKRHNAKGLLAISDERLAHDNLRKFKQGGYDLLATVGMCHVGYDHQPITVVCCLNGIRWYGWLDQFFARGMRVMKDIPYDQQTIWAIVPDDKRMVAYVQEKQRQSQQGVKERKDGGPPPPPKEERFGQTVWAGIDGTEAMGVNPEMFASAEEYSMNDQLVKQYKLGVVRLSGLSTLMRDVFGGKYASEQAKDKKPFPDSAPKKTQQEQEKDYRAHLKHSANDADKLMNIPYGSTSRFLIRAFNGSQTKADLTELKQRLEWLKHTWKPAIRSGRVTGEMVLGWLDQGLAVDWKRILQDE